MKHLTDTQIQEYLAEDHAEYATHLSACSECREQLDHYSTLHSIIVQQPVAKLPAEFKSNLIARIQIDSGRQRRWENFIVGLILTIGVAAVVYFIRPIEFLSLFEWFNIDSIAAIFQPLRSWVKFSYLYLSAAAFILILYHLVDRVFLHTRILRH